MWPIRAISAPSSASLVISVAVDPHSAYGPGLKGFGKNAGVSLLQDATVEFFGTFAIPAIVHQDPRYYRMPDRPFKKRLIYSISRTVISRQRLTASPCPTTAPCWTTPSTPNSATSTCRVSSPTAPLPSKRVLFGYALDPVNNILNEFLPDVAKHVHVRIIFIQRILNNIAASANGLPCKFDDQYG